MANTFDAFMDRLIAASGDFNAAPVGQTALIDSVYRAVSPSPGTDAATVRIPYPSFPAFADQAKGDLQISDADAGYVDVAVTQLPAASIIIRDLEQLLTPGLDLAGMFIDPAWKAAAEYGNAQIAGLITDNVGGFDAIPPIVSSKVGAIDVDDERDAWDQLVTARVPLTQYGDARILLHNNVQRNLGMDDNYANAAKVGMARADAFIADMDQGKRARFMPGWDQQMPTGLTANLTGTVAVDKGSTTVTGTSTAFTTEAPVGSYLQFNGAGRFYRVRSVASATSLTIAQPFQDANITGKSYKRRTYLSVAMHKYAIACVFVPPPMVNDGSTQSALLMARGIPLRVQYGYMRAKQGNVLSLHFGFGGKVARPGYGVLIKS